jgi:acyl carrier protein
MSSTRDIESLKSELKSLIISSANLNHLKPEGIGDDDPLFKNGLGLDSIDLLEIVVNIEKKYGFKIQNNEAGQQALRSVNCLATAVAQHLNPAS